MLGIFKSGPKSLQVGVDFLATGVSVVAVNTTARNAGEIRFNDFLPSVGAQEQGEALREWVDSRGLNKASCNALIAKHDVQILQVEKPAVEDSELLQAVSWKLKDQISFDIAAAVVDIFQMPSSSKTPQQQVNAVVANEVVVGNYVERIRESGLELNAIDIHDLVSKHFSRVYGFTDKTFALLQFGDNEGLLSIYHEGDLYVSRDLKFGVLALDENGEGDDSIYDKLLLELQRSMDYFEAYYGLGQIQEMMLFPSASGMQRMANYLQNYVAYEVDFVQIRAAGSGETGEIDSHCFPAYCAALRGLIT